MVITATEYLSLKTSPAAAGDGSGLLLVAETASGAILGAAAPCSKRGGPEEIGSRLAADLLEDLSHGGCADRWWALNESYYVSDTCISMHPIYPSK